LENRHFNSFTGFNVMQNPYNFQLSAHGIIHDGLSGQMGYGNYMETSTSPFYTYYAQLMAQLQSGMIFNERSHYQARL
jgi:hypothetical protein